MLFRSKNAILPCASPRSSSTKNVGTSCDELLALPCCSNNEASTSSSAFVATNHVEERKDLKAQVASLKRGLEKRHEGKSALDNMLSAQQSPNDKSGLGFNSNNKDKSKVEKKKKKGQVQIKNPANIICFKCKVEGHHVRDCPMKKKYLSEKQLGKRPLVQSRAQPRVEQRSPPKKTQANAPQVEEPIKKKKKSRCCYLCRGKGHFASSCTNGTPSNPIIFDDVYSLGKDRVEIGRAHV